jgi:hypothetical protein
VGYYSTASGEITFSPELPRYAVRGNEIIHKYTNGEDDITLDAEWSNILPPEDTFKAYWIKENLIELVAEIFKINADTKFQGYIEIHGEGDGVGDIDLWRLYVKNNQVVESRPKLVWPEDV